MQMQSQLRQRLAQPAAFRPAQCMARRSTVVVRASAVAPPATLPVLSVDGQSKGEAQLALKVAGATAKGLVHRYLVMVQQNKRQGTSSTLTRMEVRGGGKKPFAQKGTGNARRGSSTSPLFPGGGVTFGPKPKDWTIKMNKKERRLALATALQSAAADLLVVESLQDKVTDKKTKSLLSVLGALGINPERKTLLVLKDAHEHIMLAGRNVEKLKICTADKIYIFDLLNADKVVFEQGALEFVQSFYGGSERDRAAAAPAAPAAPAATAASIEAPPAASA